MAFAIVNLLLEYPDLRKKFSLPLAPHLALCLETLSTPLSPSLRLVFSRALSHFLSFSLSLDLASPLLLPRCCQFSFSLQTSLEVVDHAHLLLYVCHCARM